jgi:hypothetical protein
VAKSQHWNGRAGCAVIQRSDSIGTIAPSSLSSLYLRPLRLLLEATFIFELTSSYRILLYLRVRPAAFRLPSPI